jgi:diguanylate cyclase (GGDEF)-like protein
VRERFPKSELAIIVVSGVIHTKMVPLLLKAGANDFLQKPFGKEEFMVRITNTLELIDLIKELEFYAYRDPLTGLYNRRYFFEEAPKLWNLAKRRNLNLICVMMDIDDFKKINDLYGHEVGDLVLKDFSKKLQKFFQRGEDLLARIGGEEFVLLITFTEKTEILKYLESFREYIAKEPLKGEDFEVSYTISMGVETELKNSLKEMMISADRKLYEAKAKGKNCIVV